MPSNNQTFDIQDEDDLKAAVRSVTQYDTEKVSTQDLDQIVDDAKRILALRTGLTDFFNDRGVAVALQGIVAAKAKGAVENSPVRVKNIGPHDVTFRTSDGASLQVTQYEDMVRYGLSEAENVGDATQNIELTRTFLHD